MIVTKFEGPERAGRCKVEVLQTDDPDELRMEGYCAVAAGRSTLALRVLRINGTRLQAGFRANGIAGTAQFGGTYRDDGMQLQSKLVFEQDGQMFHSRITINFRDDTHFTLDNWMRPENASGPERHVVSLTFERQKPSG